MYGLEKNAGGKFAFDLEKEIKANPLKAKSILDEVETKIHDTKKQLRAGADEKDFDRLNVLLNGYTALQKVLKKATK